jgi:hypothetical protein
MGIATNIKPIYSLGFSNFGCQNLYMKPFRITSSHPFVDLALSHREPAENLRLGRITSNATSCVEEVRL